MTNVYCTHKNVKFSHKNQFKINVIRFIIQLYLFQCNTNNIINFMNKTFLFLK